MIRPAEYKVLPVSNLAGLELETNIEQRPVNSWTKLENFDLLISGAIRRIKGLKELIDNKYDTPITVIRTYRRSADDPRLIIGISASGGVYDLETADLLTQFPTVNFPFAGSMPGTAEGLSSDDPGGPSKGRTINYLITTTAGFFPFKWDGTANVPSIIGVKSPERPVSAIIVLVQLTTDPSISLLVSRRYRYTYWNPTTRHESSPSPDVDPLAEPTGPLGVQDPLITADLVALIAQGLSRPPLIAQVILSVADIGSQIRNEAIFNGYTRLRFYATRDGGEEFFLCTSIIWHDPNTAMVHQADTDSSVPINTAAVSPGPPFDFQYFDGSDLNSIFNVGVAYSPTPDPSLIVPGPAAGENDPPPAAIWGAIYQGRLWLQDADDPTRIVFSKTAEFESYPVDNVIEVPADDYDPITALDGQFQQLLVGKIRSTERITGSDLTDFVLSPLDPQTGFTGRRSLARFEGSMLFLSRIGIMQWAGDQSDFYGRSVSPLTDEIPEDVKLERIVAGTDAENGFVLFSRIHRETQGNPPIEQEIADILISNTPLRAVDNQRQDLPFSLMTGLPAEVTSFGESVLIDNDERTLVACKDCRVYLMFETPEWATAIAETQLIPQDDPYSRKVFRYLRTSGEAVGEGFEYEVIVDGIVFPARPLYGRNFLGVVGKQIQITFVHRAAWTGDQPVLSNYVIEYSLIGEAR